MTSATFGRRYVPVSRERVTKQHADRFHGEGEDHNVTRQVAVVYTWRDVGRGARDAFLPQRQAEAEGHDDETGKRNDSQATELNEE